MIIADAFLPWHRVNAHLIKNRPEKAKTPVTIEGGHTDELTSFSFV